ncbi:MAG: replicative DNA helicase [Phycisphaerae bacterium]|nr:replicative DNA helicase [Phycisphaerae bacterium]
MSSSHYQDAQQPGSTESSGSAGSALNASRTTRPAVTRADRVPPQDIEAEMSLLGSMMLSRDAIGDVLPLIHRSQADRFYRPDHRLIFQTLIDMYDRGDPIDLVTVRNEMDRLGILERIGGKDYIIELAQSVPSHLHAEHYAQLVRDKAMLRDLIGASALMADEAYAHQDEARIILDRAEQALFKVTDQRIADQAAPIRDSLEEIWHLLESRDGNHITGVPTGFVELDDMLSGMQPGEMIIVAARPSMGKTALGLSMAEHVSAVAGLPAAFFSMEMSRRSVVQRLLCSRARIDSHKMRRGMLNESELGYLHDACGQLADVQLFVDDTPGMSVLELRAKSRRLKSRFGIQCIFVDYLQLMTSPGRSESRQQEVSEISRGLKALARELNIPVVVLAQLNRNPEGRTDNRPRMSDLRESGSIEQDADVVMLIHREEYYKKESCPEELRGVSEIIIDKQRNGPTGVVRLFFNHRYTRFDNYSIDAGGYEQDRTDGRAMDGSTGGSYSTPSIPSPRNYSPAPSRYTSPADDDSQSADESAPF